MTPFPLDWSPAAIVMALGLLALFLPRAGRNLIGLVAMGAGLLHLLAYGVPEIGGQRLYGAWSILDFEMTTVRVDRLSFVFALIFTIAGFLNVIYGWRHATRVEASTGLIYAGSAIGGALAGDLLTLFFFWEAAALSSVFIIWQAGTKEATFAGVRYLVLHVFSGLLLLTGVVLVWGQGGDLTFGALSLWDEAGALNLAALLILASFAIKAAFPLVHTWLPDTYPKASAVGAVILSAFTTKLAIYALARSFAGLDLLIGIGVAMALFPLLFALLEDDLRKVLAHALNVQLGFLVCAVGIGTPLAINGAAAHAFIHILYKALLFMSMGAVLLRTGTTRASELGGLHKSMPWTAGFCLVAAFATSAVPLFSGFITKSMITGAASEAHLIWVYTLLLIASAGVVENSGIRVPFFAFFATDRFAPSRTGQRRPEEAPAPMMIAMGMAAGLSILIGVRPDLLEAILPYETDYHAFSWGHVTAQLQLVLGAVLTFAVLYRLGVYPVARRTPVVDVDWLWRVPGKSLLLLSVSVTASLWHAVWGVISQGVQAMVSRLYYSHGPEGRMARTWPVGYTALTTAIVLGVVLFSVYFAR
ncbi:NADH dehydrogenase subunit N [Parvularcula bermudensis HTCC2503]|uniref:NADH dehydrogenase subunit N n=1 Tax=Parvularcula bermudensis (strain ATCC BAA-594 / HTCC2503 / KCTC 12087) TaxID=314260 RepID=E0TD57_PARBH|nr:Na(+)/H(+) antiporter subunit D [Parvularcula bermudensis]ADM08716.1 NADH dehydrogenase subunit N [Parvularcula bermudensis HTCC2503]